jgi:hypothetical protein
MCTKDDVLLIYSGNTQSNSLAAFLAGSWSSGQSEGNAAPTSSMLTGDPVGQRHLPSIPSSLGNDGSPRFVLQRSGVPFVPSLAAAAIAASKGLPVTADGKHAKKKPRHQPSQSSSSSLHTGMSGSYQYSSGHPHVLTDAVLQAQARENAERAKAQMIADAAEMVLRMKPSSSSVSSGPLSAVTSSVPPQQPAQTSSLSSSILSRLESLTGNNLLSSTVFPPDASRDGSGESSAGGPFKLQGLVGLNSVLNSTGLSRLPAMLFGGSSSSSSSDPMVSGSSQLQQQSSGAKQSVE